METCYFSVSKIKQGQRNCHPVNFTQKRTGCLPKGKLNCGKCFYWFSRKSRITGDKAGKKLTIRKGTKM